MYFLQFSFSLPHDLYCIPHVSHAFNGRTPDTRSRAVRSEHLDWISVPPTFLHHKSQTEHSTPIIWNFVASRKDLEMHLSCPPAH